MAMNTSDPDAWSSPGEVTGLTFLSDARTLTWDPPAEPGGNTLMYDTIRWIPFKFTFQSRQLCLESDDHDTTVTVEDDPSLGSIHLYMVRADNGRPWEEASPGTDSAGRLRAARPCP